MRTILLLACLSSAALAPLTSASAREVWACTDIPYDDTCPSTLCASPTPETGFCTTESICVVGETRCIGSLACVELSQGSSCVPDPCYRTVCTRAASPDPTAAWPYCFVEIVGPDLVLRSCLDPGDPDCLVYTERWGKEGEYMGKSCSFP